MGRASSAGLRNAIAIVAVAAAGACAWAARQQLGIWRNSDTVFIGIIEGTPNAIVRKQNFVRWAHASANLGRYASAKAILAERQREYPDSALTDKFDRGTDVPRAFAGLDQDRPPAWTDDAPEAAGNLKIALDAAKAERTVEAEEHFRRSLMISPGYRDAQYNFAMFLGLHGRPREALHLYFILATGKGREGFAGECTLLSVIARAFWDGREPDDARTAMSRALACAGRGNDAALAASLLRQAQEYGVQTVPALRDSTIR
jgi:tetratricopeptide (TPR) repeat protein